MTSIIARSYDSAHWYRAEDGAPQYTVIAKDGTDRPTTLRDARKMNLVPSVTTVLKIVAKPALDIWKQEQMLLAALTLPRMPDENEKDYIVRIVADSKETAKIAAAKGSAIHESIEKWFNGDYQVEHKETSAEFECQVLEHFSLPRGLIWSTEKSFGSSVGYGGKPDLYLPVNEFAPDGILLDTKSMDFDEDKEIKGYDENLLQLAAYRNGIGLPKARCANVYTSRTIPGLVKIVEWSEEDLQRGYQMFLNLLSYWKLKNKFSVQS
jgi:hypothetical protein